MTHEELLDELDKLYTDFTFYQIKDWREDDFNEEGCHMEVFEIVKERTPETFLEIPYTVNGDYVGCTASKSNCRSIRRDFPQTILTWGSYSSEMLLVRLSDLAEDEALLDVIKELDEYPLYDESDESELLIELESEAWDCWVEYEFKRELSKIIEDEDIDEETHHLSSIFYKFMEITGCNFYPEGTDVTIDLDGMIKKMIENHAEEFWEIIKENKKDLV